MSRVSFRPAPGTGGSQQWDSPARGGPAGRRLLSFASRTGNDALNRPRAARGLCSGKAEVRGHTGDPVVRILHAHPGTMIPSEPEGMHGCRGHGGPQPGVLRGIAPHADCTGNWLQSSATWFFF